MAVSRVNALLPWLAGAGLAAGQIAASTGCTVPRSGQCSTCGGCVVAVGALAGWALLKRRRGGGDGAESPRKR